MLKQTTSRMIESLIPSQIPPEPQRPQRERWALSAVSASAAVKGDVSTGPQYEPTRRAFSCSRADAARNRGGHAANRPWFGLSATGPRGCDCKLFGARRPAIVQRGREKRCGRSEVRNGLRRSGSASGILSCPWLHSGRRRRLMVSTLLSWHCFRRVQVCDPRSTFGAEPQPDRQLCIQPTVAA